MPPRRRSAPAPRSASPHDHAYGGAVTTLVHDERVATGPLRRANDEPPRTRHAALAREPPAVRATVRHEPHREPCPHLWMDAQRKHDDRDPDLHRTRRRRDVPGDVAPDELQLVRAGPEAA